MAVENDDFKRAAELAKELVECDFLSLSEDEKKKLLDAVSDLIKRAKDKEIKIAETISKKVKARKFFQ
ncbi:hypothetical protein [Desulfurobacterium indicum]|uniref:hypothetical protein n=1 Tax=Desulfurobacterium indicum TaxID=1914305 RepID=UPI001198296D|nr:hypothetical protein [Desulfurobacterium indicum]